MATPTCYVCRAFRDDVDDAPTATIEVTIRRLDSGCPDLATVTYLCDECASPGLDLLELAPSPQGAQ